tara:strand:- start:14 stop:145 length:132 start_codon:yes stop_codon:yes gene_type:complete
MKQRSRMPTFTVLDPASMPAVEKPWIAAAAIIAWDLPVACSLE